MSNQIPETHVDLIDNPVVVMVATVMPNTQPQVTPIWANRQGNQIWLNSAAGRQKDKNMRERPRVTIAAVDPNNPYRWIEIRGVVSEVIDDQEQTIAHIHELSNQYFGRDYTSFAEGEKRVIYKIEPTKINTGG